MSERIKLDECRKGKDEFLHWFLIHASTLVPQEQFSKMVAAAGNEDGTHEVSLVMDGVELPVIQTFRELAKQDSRRISEGAAELLKSKLGEQLSGLEDLLGSVRKYILREGKEKLGLKLDEEE